MHDVVHHDVASLTMSQREALWLQLRLADISYAFDGSTVAVAVPNADAVLELIADVRAVIGDEHLAQPRPFRRRTSDGLVVAGRTRRLTGAIVDFVVLGVPLALMAHVHVSLLFGLLLDAAYYVLPTWIAGRTLGKLVAGTRVIGTTTRRRPTLMTAVVRWAVPASVQFGYLLVRDRPVAWLVVMARLAVYAPLLWDRDGRGLHDRAAKTMVVKS